MTTILAPDSSTLSPLIKPESVLLDFETPRTSRIEGAGRTKRGRGTECTVCGAVATGIHYRAVTCEGCKGFWRRSIQNGFPRVYSCKTGTIDCSVNTETRGRCQRCRFNACVKAGMVADLVMTETERMNRRQLVDQNRERRGGSRSAPTTQDAFILEFAHSSYLQLLLNNPTDTLGDLNNSYTFADQLLHAMSWDNCQVVMSPGIQEEVFYTHTAFTRDPASLQRFPRLAQFSSQLRKQSISVDQLVLALCLVVVRPRLTSPSLAMADLNTVFELVSGAVQRSFGPDQGSGSEQRLNFAKVLHVFHMAGFASNFLDINQIITQI